MLFQLIELFTSFSQVQGGSELNILQLTDFHYDPLYKPGSNAQCDEPLCCQNGTPSSPENAAGYWGDYNVCDMPWHSVTNLIERIKNNHVMNFNLNLFLE